MGVNQTTVARRIEALEAALSIRLFHRNRDGYRLTEEGTAILAQAERVAAEIQTLEHLATQRNRHRSNVVRITTVQDIANVILTPWLGEFMNLYPDIRVEVIATERCLDLNSGEADIAIRAGSEPMESGLIARKLAEGQWLIYCSSDYAAKHGSPARAEDLDAHMIIGREGELVRLGYLAWLEQAAPRATVRNVCSTISHMLAAIKAGHGIGALPSSVGLQHPDLIECFAIPSSRYGYYLVWREFLKDVSCVKALNGFIMARAPALKRALEGKTHLGH
jgi:DNA-binding transcriptional LysR family regulator